METAEVIAIGDELTSGQRVDTNSAWLSQQLQGIGIRVLFHTTVADQHDSLRQVLADAMRRVDVVVCTGGLGPTADDLTRQAIAEVVGRPLVLDAGALEHIQQLFASRGRAMPTSNQIQAMFPEGSRVLPNPHGTAPGIQLTHPRDHADPVYFFALPGVPVEMREMWDQSVGPQLGRLMPQSRVIRHQCVRCFGVGESHLEQMLPDLIRRGRQPSVGITVHRATITLRITAEGATAEECDGLIQPTVRTIEDCLGSLVYGYGDDQLHDVVMRELMRRRETLATIEWGTNATVCGWLSDGSAAHAGYRAGLWVQGMDNLSALLGMQWQDGSMDVNGAEALTRQMAMHMRQRLGTHYALAVGPRHAQWAGTPPNAIPISLATPQEVFTHFFAYSGHPDILDERAGKCALDLLRLNLRNEPARGAIRPTDV